MNGQIRAVLVFVSLIVNAFCADNIINLYTHQAILDDTWIIMQHDPMSELRRHVSVAVIDSNQNPIWSVTYMMYDIDTHAGLTLLQTATGWHRNEAKMAHNNFEVYFDRLPKGDGRITCLDFMVPIENERKCKLVRVSRRGDDTDIDNIESLIEECAQYALRLR